MMRIVLLSMFIACSLSMSYEMQDSIELDVQYDSASLKKLETLEFVTDPYGMTKSLEIPIVPYYKLDDKPRIIECPKLNGIWGFDKSYALVVKMLISSDGTIVDSKVVQPSGNAQLDSFVLGFVLDYKFTPPKYRGRCVRTWVSAPFRFHVGR